MIAIITGASRGIGLAIADKMIAEGYDVIINARTQASLENAQKNLQIKYPFAKVHIFCADLTNTEAVKTFAAYCLQFGTPDVLVNNAGKYLPGNCLDEPEHQLEEMLHTNLLSAYTLTRLIVPAMVRAGKGHIFNMCSIAGLQAYPGGGSYSISKFALNGFTQNLRHELKPHKVKVTGIFPGAVFTDSWEGFDNREQRIMVPEDIASIVYNCTTLSLAANVEEIIIRPQLGDL